MKVVPQRKIRTMNENSLKNLRAPWRKGESGNRAGRKPLGLTLIEWLNEIGDAMERGTMTVDDLDDMADREPNGNKRMAARVYRRALNDSWHASTPKGMADMQFITEHTHGRAVQQLIVKDARDFDVEAALAGMADLLRQFPELANEVAAHQTIDTTARELPAT